MALRSHNISYSTADQADVLAFPGSNGNLTADQQRCLCNMRKAARARQDDLDHQGVGWGLPIPEALDHLLAGHTSSAAECAGNAYYCALQIIIDRNASDPYTLGAYSKPSTFFRLVDEEMRRLGVPDDLLPHGYLYGGLPAGFPHIPHSLDGYPTIGHLPLARTKPAADAYRAVLDRMDPDFRHDVQDLIEKLDFEHEEWQSATRNVDWYTQDTLFFSLICPTPPDPAGGDPAAQAPVTAETVRAAVSCACRRRRRIICGGRHGESALNRPNRRNDVPRCASLPQEPGRSQNNNHGRRLPLLGSRSGRHRGRLGQRRTHRRPRPGDTSTAPQNPSA